MELTEQKYQGIRFLLSQPALSQPEVPYPVIIFLHGAGTRGDDMEALRKNPFFQHLPGRPDFPFVVAAPLCTENTWIELWERLMSLVKHVASLPYIDPSRIYVIGASMGGYAAWQLAMSLPDCFAAMVPICGGGMFWNASRLVNIPVWAFHGGRDPVIPPEESQKMVDAVNAAGGCARLTLYPEHGHDVWSDTYSDPEVFRWLLQHRSAAKAPLADTYRNIQKYG